ncbi:MAG: hypothetical protein V1835_02395 [Candidatus Micrarchaeota archaeon]
MRELRWLAYFSLIYGGFLVITYLTFGYFAIWRNEILPIFPDNRVRQFNASMQYPSPLPFTEENGTRAFIGRDRQPEMGLSQVLSIQALGVLLTGIAFLLNGYILMKYLREKEHKETRNFTISTLLTGDEKAMYDQLVKQHGEATQKQLAINTGFNAVKTFRVLQRLEDKKVIKTYPYGMTKKIIINEKMN